MAATLEAGRDHIIAGVPLARIGEPDDVAGACIFLSSRAGSYVNGLRLIPPSLSSFLFSWTDEGFAVVGKQCDDRVGRRVARRGQALSASQETRPLTSRLASPRLDLRLDTIGLSVLRSCVFFFFCSVYASSSCKSSFCGADLRRRGRARRGGEGERVPTATLSARLTSPRG